MLKRLTLKNFRQHEDRVIDLTAGLNVVRGANEAGKSTLIEAIAYALFGSKACREPLAQVVTWGKPEKSLAVELVLAADGIDYVFTRSPKGAEVNYPGGRVVGQSEVTLYAQKLLGADSATGGKLMLASQGAIRGALDEGATKTMKLIEDLADFAVIDNVIELLLAQYVTGPSQTAEDRLTQAKAAHRAAQAAAVAPDTAELEAKVGTLAAVIKATQGDIDKDLKPAYEKARGDLNAAEGALKQRQGLQQELQRLHAQRAERVAARAAAAEQAKAAPAAGAVEAAREAVQQAQNAANLRAVWDAYNRLKLPEVHWEGSRASFDADVAKLEGMRIQAGAGSVAAVKNRDAARAEIRVLEAQRVTGSACGFCGTDVSAVPEVVRKNTTIDASITQQRQALAVAEKAVAENDRACREANEALADLQAVEKAAKPFYDFLVRYPDNVTINDITVPPGLMWKGPVPQEVDVANLRRILANLEAAQKAADAARVRVEMLDKQIDEDDRTIVMRQKQVEQCNYADKLPEVRAAFEAAEEAYNEALTQVTLIKQQKSELESEIKVAQATYQQALRGVEAADKAVMSARKELDDLIFNNALLKRIKTARPLIADKLWNIVLAAVSTYFSAMRGAQSVVSRQGNQFLVDGKPIEGLSGSTLDILGLSIRLALTKTFLPTAPFLILDEPAAAMDDSRTQSTLGFLVASGFQQTLLVTHEEQSEAVADNLITI